jgi:hypothetical protein
MVITTFADSPTLSTQPTQTPPCQTFADLQMAERIGHCGSLPGRSKIDEESSFSDTWLEKHDERIRKPGRMSSERQLTATGILLELEVIAPYRLSLAYDILKRLLVCGIDITSLDFKARSSLAGQNSSFYACILAPSEQFLQEFKNSLTELHDFATWVWRCEELGTCPRPIASRRTA